MDALAMEFPDDSFDLVWACESGEHMPDKKAYVEEMARVLAPGGQVGRHSRGGSSSSRGGSSSKGRSSSSSSRRGAKSSNSRVGNCSTLMLYQLALRAALLF